MMHIFPFDILDWRGGYTRPLRWTIAIVLVFLAQFHDISSAKADIVKTLEGVFQTTQKTGKVLTSQNPPGIFVILGSPIDLQLFDPSKVKKGEALHAFIQYSPELDRYTALMIGAQEFKIKGGLTVMVRSGTGTARIGIDNNNPYLSVTFDDTDRSKKSEPSLVGFRGTMPVVLNSGQYNVALTEANQFNQFKDIIEPYDLTSHGLMLKGHLLSNTAVGIDLDPPRNVPCLKPDVLFLTPKEIDKVRSAKTKEESIRALDTLLSAKREDPLRGLLLLRIEPTEMIGLDYSKGYGASTVKIFSPFKKMPDRPICLIKTISLDD